MDKNTCISGIIMFVMALLILASCSKNEESELSKYCRTVFKQTGKCPEDKCEIGCGPVSIFDRGGCPAACNPKSCSEFNFENCPLETCQTMTNCKGEKVCSSKFIGNPPKCGKEGYYGQDVPCCEGLEKRCDFSDSFPICMPPASRNEKWLQELCEESNGIWKEFPNSGNFCQDECYKPENTKCAKFASMGCDCGTNKCWGGTSCVDSRQETVMDIIELCETENPQFDADEECRRIIEQKYPNKKCTFEFTETKYMPLGSCRNCLIICSAYDRS